MPSFDWKGIVKKAAPWIGGALGGPLGATAGKLVAVALGGDETKATEADLAKLVQNVTPEQLLALKQADQAFQLQLKQMDINELKDLEALAVQDRSSARLREMTVRDNVPAIGFYGITVGFFGLLIFLLFRPIPDANKASVYTMLGSLGTAWIGCVNYYFGSTSGSRSKDLLLFKSKPVGEE